MGHIKESHGLLEDESDGVDALETHCSQESFRRHQRSIRNQRIHITILYVILTVVILNLVFQHLSRCSDPSLGVYSPANEAVKWQQTVFWDNIDEWSPFQGEPNDEKDRMWDLLYRGTSSVRISAQAAGKLPNQTMVLPGTDGDGILQIEVFHQLHCLNALRKGLYPDRFPDYGVFHPNGTRNLDMSIHQDHCIDRIRQGIMCASDLGSLVYKWDEDQQKWRIRMKSVHTCRNFDAIRNWATERGVLDWDVHAKSTLTHSGR